VSNVIGDFNFSLSNNGDSIILRNTSDKVILRFRFNDAKPWPQCADGNGRTLENVNTSTNPSLSTSWFDGCMLGSPGAPYIVCNEGDIIFNEINYKSASTNDAGDWVELLNKSAIPINVGGWQFLGNKNTNAFTLPANTIIPSNGFLAIYSDSLKFKNVHPTVTNKTGPFQFGLSANGEVIRLYDNSGKIQLSMYYNNLSPWPTAANGGGATIELIQSNLELNKGASWQESCPNGSPGDTNRIGTLANCFLKLDKNTVNDFTIYPNPSTGIYYLNNERPLNATVLNTLGQIVWQTEIKNILDIKALNSGIYYLKLEDKTQRRAETYKLIKL
jgi:hypothetical protein